MTSLYDCLGTGGGGSLITVGPTAPSPPTDQQLWLDTTTNQLKVYQAPPAGAGWTVISGGGGAAGGGIIVSATDPGSATQTDGTGWLNPTTGELKIANNGVWVDAGQHDIVVLGKPALAAITATANLIGTTGADVTVAGGPADKAYTATLTYRINAQPGPQQYVVQIAIGDTADSVANQLVANAPATLTAVKTGVGLIHFGLAPATNSLDAIGITVA